jgi:GNAT superfamily N-acetyltransferase
MGRPVRDPVEVTLRLLREEELPAFVERGQAEYERELVELTGYGRAAMLALEGEAERRGLSGVDLNVWAGNDVARSLYRSLGYVERGIFMRKNL